jgi:hypothetical protein
MVQEVQEEQEEACLRSPRLSWSEMEEVLTDFEESDSGFLIIIYYDYSLSQASSDVF